MARLLLKRAANRGVIRNGLMAEYRFNEGSGQVLNDRSGKGNNGQLGSTTIADDNDPTWTTAGLSFTGNDFVVVPLVATTAGWTYETIISNDAPVATDPAYYIYEGVAANLGVGVGIRGSGAGADAGKLKLYTADSVPSAKTLTSNTALSTAPTHAVFTWDGATISCYLNGTKQASTTAMVSFNGYSTAIISKLSYTVAPTITLYYHNKYNRALSQAEISLNYAYLKTNMAARGVTLP